jgi:uncharacterized membrane protein
MSIGPWLHLAHVAGAIIWVGGGVLLSVIALRVRRSGDVAILGDFAGTLSWVGLRVLSPAVIVVLVSGIWMVLNAGGDFTTLWIALALVAFALAFLIGAVFLSRSAIRLERVAREGDLAAARDALGAWLRGYGLVLVILAFAVWDMVFKPGA